MQELLMRKLHDYLVQNHLDILIPLQQEGKVTGYIAERVESVSGLLDALLKDNRPGYVIEALCLEQLTAEFGPSKYTYVLEVFQEEFPADFEALREKGTITYEVLNMVQQCEAVFETFKYDFESRFLRYAVIAKISLYLL